MAAQLDLESHTHNWGLFRVRWNRNYEIQRATILLDDRLAGKRLKHFVLEEIVQCLGPAGDSHEFPGSVFYEDLPVKEYGTATRLTSLDCQTLQFLYNHVPPGTTAIELGALIERHWK